MFTCVKATERSSETVMNSQVTTFLILSRKKYSTSSRFRNGKIKLEKKGNLSRNNYSLKEKMHNDKINEEIKNENWI